jgi:hypothetical protein
MVPQSVVDGGHAIITAAAAISVGGITKGWDFIPDAADDINR